MKQIKVMKLKSDAILPTRAHDGDAGLDLYSLENYTIEPGEIVKVSTGVAVGIEHGYVGFVRDRSSVGSRGLKVTAGIIDAGYTGEATVVLINVSNRPQTIGRGLKIAQLLVLPVALPQIVEVKSFDKTERGDKGFGSSGV